MEAPLWDVYGLGGVVKDGRLALVYYESSETR